VDGVVQMNTNGNFIGYFAANTAEMSLQMTLQRMFLTQEQLAQFVKNEAASPSNLAIDNQGMIYTITAGTTPPRSIRKFNIAGRNIYPNIIGSSTFRDIDVSDSGLVVAVDADGHIYEYDLTGVLLFQFGAKDRGEQRTGTLINPTAIGRYGDFIYVLDKDKNAIVQYQTTAFAQTVHSGIRLYMDGYYEEAKPYFEDVLNYNGLFITSYKAIADAYFKEQNYTKALEYYRYAEDRNGYSQAYWEMRNVALQNYLSPAVMGVLGLSIVQSGVKRLNKRYKWFDPIGEWFRSLTNIKIIDDFVFMFRFIGQPAASFFYIKKDKRGSLGFALLIIAWVAVVRVLTLYWTGFPFNSYASPSDIRIENEVLMVVGLIELFIAAN
jgi:tetratricopeptide (TPR) repeat protein